MQATTDEVLILVIDPNVSHSSLIRQVLEDQPKPVSSDRCSKMARWPSDFLHQRGEFTAAKRPHLILLELDLPDQDGRALLAEIKKRLQPQANSHHCFDRL